MSKYSQDITNWDFGAFGGAGFGGADLKEMQRRGYGYNAIEELSARAQSSGRNVGRKVRDWLSANRGTGPSPTGHNPFGDMSGFSTGDMSNFGAGDMSRFGEGPVSPSAPERGGRRPLIDTWDFALHGGAGFGGQDIRAAKQQGLSDDEIAMLAMRAQSEGRNVGKKGEVYLRRNVQGLRHPSKKKDDKKRSSAARVTGINY